MALAPLHILIQDDEGNIITENASVRVTNELTSQLAQPLTTDFAGATPAGNPATISNGVGVLFTVGGWYKVEATTSQGTRTKRYVPAGTAQAEDAEALGRAGLAFSFESETSAPPSASSIRANNADLSAATKLYIDDETLGGVDVSATLIALDPGSKTEPNRIRLTVGSTDVLFDVDGTTDQTGYVEIDVSGHDGGTALDVGTARVNIEWSGAGNMSAASDITDNALVRGDGGGKGLQETGIAVDDSDNMTGVENLGLSTINGWTPREVLTGNRTYYVDGGSGSDSNDGLSSGAGAFATIQKAVNVAATIDLNGNSITISVAAGTYNEAVTLKTLVGGNGSIVGDTSTPSNVVVNATGNCFLANGVLGVWSVSGFRMIATGNCIDSENGSVINVGLVEYGAAVYHLRAIAGTINLTGAYEIIDDATRHISLQTAAILVVTASFTVTLTGTPAFTHFVHCQEASVVRHPSSMVTFSGSATGTRYLAITKGLINTFGGGASYFPGDVGGSTGSDGLYA